MRTLTFALGIILLTGSARAGETPVAVSQVVALAEAAAHSWADDARLIYVENDADIDIDGRAARWGLLYWSTSRDEARVYSLRENKVARAEALGFDFDAPPLADEWIDSVDALHKADAAGGDEYRTASQGRLRSMVLTRGLFHLDDADRTTWTCVYDAPGQPSLWVVLDARNGDVLRRWKG